MKRMIILWLVVLSIGVPAAAQQKDLARERVQLLFKQVPVTQVLPAFAKSLGYELSLDPSLRALVTIEVENVTAETALNAICESIGCRWRKEGTLLVVAARTDVVTTLRSTRKGEEFVRGGGNIYNYAIPNLDDELPFTISWSPVDIYVAFSMLARMYNAQVWVDPALQSRKLAVTVKEGSLRQAFDAICAVAGCRWQLVEQPKRMVRVVNRTEEQAGTAAANAPRVYTSNDVGLTPPTLLHEVKPQYVPDAMRAKIQGTVRLECVVLPDGTIGDVRVIESLDTVYGLDEEAVKAARAWRFSPGTKDGRPVPVLVTIELGFKLK